MPRKKVLLKVSLPQQLYMKISNAARNRNLCMNEDIVCRLDQSFSARQTYRINMQIKEVLFEHIELLEDQIVLLNAELANYRLSTIPLQEPTSCC